MRKEGESDRSRMPRITSSTLAQLGHSSVWKNSNSLLSSRFTPEDIYGAKGKLKSFSRRSWNSTAEMRLAFYEKMGGGVPIEIIEELISLCVNEEICTSSDWRS